MPAQSRGSSIVVKGVKCLFKWIKITIYKLKILIPNIIQNIMHINLAATILNMKHWHLNKPRLKEIDLSMRGKNNTNLL